MSAHECVRCETSVTSRDETWLALAARAIEQGASLDQADALATSALTRWETLAN